MNDTPVPLNLFKCPQCSLEWYRRAPIYGVSPPRSVCPVCGKGGSTSCDQTLPPAAFPHNLLVIGEPQIYHMHDPERPEGSAMWSFTYLHGPAEDYMAEVEKQRGWEPTAPDIGVFDTPSPLMPGQYFCRLYGREVVVTMAWHHGRLGGRAAFPIEGDKYYRHIFQPANWR